MITRVRKYIRDNRMLKAEDMVVAGVSGRGGFHSNASYF
mgnify:CR=1 FL=1